MDWLTEKWTWLLDKASAPIKNLILKPEQREHDKKIFSCADQLLNEEDVMTRLDELQSFGTYRSWLLSTEKFYQFFRLSSNQYRDRQLKTASIKVARNLYDLLNFLANNFVVGGAEDQYAEKPEYHGEKYDNFVRDCDRKVTAFRETYRHYRELVKKKLNV